MSTEIHLIIQDKLTTHRLKPTKNDIVYQGFLFTTIYVCTESLLSDVLLGKTQGHIEHILYKITTSECKTNFSKAWNSLICGQQDTSKHHIML